MKGLNFRAVMRIAGALTLLVFAGRVLGFLREMITARQFGAGSALDTYLLANTLPGLVVVALPEAVAIAFVPMFVGAVQNGASIWSCVGKFGGRLLALAGIIGLGLFLFAEPVMRLLSQGDYHPHVSDGARLLRILAVSIPISAVVGISAAACNAVDRFAIPAMQAIVFNVAVLLLLTLRPGDITAMAAGVIGGLALQACLQLWVARRAAHGGSLEGDLVRGAYRALIPVLFYSGLIQVNTAINRMLASGLQVGAISEFNYASVLINLPASLFAASIATVLLSRFSRLAVQGDSDLAARGLIRAGFFTVLMTVPIALAVALLAHPLVETVFAHGKFTAQSARHTADALVWLSPTVVSVSLLHLALRYLNSQNRTHQLWALALVGAVLNLVVKMILVRYWGLNGIAAGTSVATMVTAIWMLWVAEPTHVRRHIRRVALAPRRLLPWR